MFSIHIRNMVRLSQTRCDEVDAGEMELFFYSEESRIFVTSDCSVCFFSFYNMS
jgi:hypothetical protein